MLAVLTLAAAPARADDGGSAEDWRSLPRVYMEEEDSHPHEVAPGDDTLFHTEIVARPSLMDVKCSLSGPARRAEIRLSGMALKAWPLAHPAFDIPPGKTIWVDVVAVVAPGTAAEPFFAFRNLDASRLLWHQCYNN